MNQLTPQITPLATEVINDPTMPAGLFQSYARLYAAAAAHDFQHTGPLDFDSQVVPLLGLRRSQVRQHLQALRFAKLLDWSTDGSNRYVFRFRSRFPDSVGDGVVDLEKSLPEEIQQQQQPSEKPEPPTGVSSRRLGESSQRQGESSQRQDEVEQQVRGWLLRAGVWGDAAARLARQVAENESRQSRGESWRSQDERGTAARQEPGRRPGRADVLGWMAYCCAAREKNGIAQPAAVLAANLNAGRLCPSEYRPPLMCSRCGYSEDYCECPDEPVPGYPQEFLEHALSTRKRYTLTPHSRWGVCESCHGLPCKCE